MARQKSVSDDDVLALVRQLLATGGDRAVTFASAARGARLAAATLVQRFGSREAMLRAALVAAWDALDAATGLAEAEAPMTAKGAQGVLKALAAARPEAVDPAQLAATFRDAGLRARATGWRGRVEAALAARLGAGADGQEQAALLFAAWQGQLLWQEAGGKGFRLKDAVKRISG